VQGRPTLNKSVHLHCQDIQLGTNSPLRSSIVSLPSDARQTDTTKTSSRNGRRSCRNDGRAEKFARSSPLLSRPHSLPTSCRSPGAQTISLIASIDNPIGTRAPRIEGEVRWRFSLFIRIRSITLVDSCRVAIPAVGASSCFSSRTRAVAKQTAQVQSVSGHITSGAGNTFTLQPTASRGSNEPGDRFVGRLGQSGNRNQIYSLG
jgi:hypothetical protein